MCEARGSPSYQLVCRSLWCLLLYALISVGQARGQVVGRADLLLGSRYVLRGLTRSVGWGAQPELSLLLEHGPAHLSIGVWASYQIQAVGAPNVVEVGYGRHGFGEINVWGQLGYDYEDATGALGIVRYTFHGDPSLGGIGREANTTELYASLGFRNKYAAPRFELWRDVSVTHAWYVQALSATPIIGWPGHPLVFVTLEASIGLSLSQPQPSSSPAFAGDGITHVRISPSTQVVLHGPLRATLTYNLQLNVDPAVKRLAASRGGGSRNLLGWPQVGLSLATSR